MADTVGQVNLRAENVERILKGFAEREYKFLQAVTVQSSSSWLESYYRQTSATLTAGTTQAIRNVPRGAQPPTGDPSWTKVTAYNQKYMFDGYIYEEDVLTDAFDIQAAVLRKIAQGVAGAVDAVIWNGLTEDQSPSNINSVTLTNPWSDLTNGAPLADILSGMQAIAEDNYMEIYDGGFLFVSPKGYRDLMSNATIRNASFEVKFTDNSNGKMRIVAGLNVIVSNNVTADYALITAGKVAGTWKEVVPLKIDIDNKTDAGVRTRVRAWQIGVFQLVNPGAVCLIANTA